MAPIEIKFNPSDFKADVAAIVLFYKCLFPVLSSVTPGGLTVSHSAFVCLGLLSVSVLCSAVG